MTRAIGLGALVIGCVVAMDPNGWSPFGPSKWAIISTVGFTAGGLTVWRRARAAERRTWWIWLVLVTLLLLSALTNGDAATALVGHPDRHLGVVTWVLFWLLFSAGQLLDAAGRRIVLSAAAVAAGLMGLYATVEIAGWHPVKLATTSQRLTGTFGSASFLGAASCLLLPVAAGLATDGRRSPRLRMLWATSAALTFVALIGSGARAAWLGLFVAVAVAIVIGGATGHGDLRSLPRSTLGAVACIAVVLTAVLLPRLDDVLERDHGAASRLDEWSVALRVIGRHPVLGVGPEGYRIAVAEGIDGHYERTYGRDHTLPDRAHSAPLDVALAGGILAALAYVGVVGVIVWRALRLMRRGDALARGLAIGVVAYAVQQLFLFPLAEVDPIWWILAGIVVSTTRSTPRADDEGDEAGDGDEADNADEQRAQRSLADVVSVGAMVVAAVALVTGVLNVAADRLAKQSLTAGTHGDRQAAADDADRAADLRPDIVGYHLISADAHLRLGTLADIDIAIAEARSAMRWSAGDPLALDSYAMALLQRAIVTGTDTDVDAAFAEWQHLVDRDQHRARWQLQLGRAAALAGNDDAAVTAWTEADALDPADPRARALLQALAARG